MKLVVVGLALTALVAGMIGVVWGRAAVVSGLVFGLVATAIQWGAVAAMRPAMEADFSRFASRWGAGMALRGLGVLLFVAAVLLARPWFPPLPTALGYVGVLVPLLFMETKFLT